MGTVRRHAFVDCDADTVWKFVGAPERLAEWFPVTNCKVEGDKRFITLAAGIVFEEDIITLDHDLRRFQYKIVNNSLIKFHLATVDVIADGPTRCVVVYSTDMDPEVLALPIAGAASVGLKKVKEMFDRKTKG
ncbi:MAG: SRPBCC family protein [Actinomycetota bacterium]